MKRATKRTIGSVFAWVAFGLLSILVISTAQKGFGVPNKCEDKLKALEGRVEELEADLQKAEEVAEGWRITAEAGIKVLNERRAQKALEKRAKDALEVKDDRR